MKRMKVGVIGCGMISEIYLKNMTERFDVLEVAACADQNADAAAARARQFGVPKACGVAELIADPEIAIVVNLTVPKAHGELTMAALNAGKHVYVEKPLALSREEAKAVLELAAARGLQVACAPDTMLGAGMQTCRKLLDEGRIGRPYAANAHYLMGSMADSAHPNPGFFLQYGGGPLFDMGPYALSALVMLLGPVRTVSGAARRSADSLEIRNPASPNYGRSYPVEDFTNVSALLEHEGGAIATVTTAKESFGYSPRLEIYGTEGHLSCGDPNVFGGTITLQRRDGEREEIPFSHGFAGNSRGIGVADLAEAVACGRPPRASGALAAHVLDIMLSVYDSVVAGRRVELATSCARPEPLPAEQRTFRLTQ